MRFSLLPLLLALAVTFPAAAQGPRLPPSGEYLVLLPPQPNPDTQAATLPALAAAAEEAARQSSTGAIGRYFVLPEANALHVAGDASAILDLASRVHALAVEPASLDAVERARERVRAAALRPPRTSGVWDDPFDDTFGLSDMADTTNLGGDVVLAQLVKRADLGGTALAMTRGGDGKIYLGMSGAVLKVFDPATGSVQDRGTPVPDECST
jgi:hypothetical protein